MANEMDENLSPELLALKKQLADAERQRVRELLELRDRAPLPVKETKQEPELIEKTKTRKPREKKRPELSDYDRERKAAYEQSMAESLKSGANPHEATFSKLPKGIKEIDYAKFDDFRLSLIDMTLAGNVQWPLYLWGRVGRGKSCLAGAIYMKRTGVGQWYNYSDFCRHSLQVKQTGQLSLQHDDGRAREFSYDTWWNRHLADAAIVVIDDVGTGSSDAEKTEILWSLLECRANKPLILTSNLSPDSSDKRNLFEIFEDRVVSRILAGETIELPGIDMRVAARVGVEIE